MYALDTNILVYAHNSASPLHTEANKFMTEIMNNRDTEGALPICIPAQVLAEFLNVITWHRLEAPLPLADAVQTAQNYLNSDAIILHQQPTQLNTLLDLLKNSTSRKKIFDAALAATLKDNGISKLYTVNTKDFSEFEFLQVINPLK